MTSLVNIVTWHMDTNSANLIKQMKSCFVKINDRLWYRMIRKHIHFAAYFVYNKFFSFFFLKVSMYLPNNWIRRKSFYYTDGNCFVILHLRCLLPWYSVSCRGCFILILIASGGDGTPNKKCTLLNELNIQKRLVFKIQDVGRSAKHSLVF